MSALSSTWLRVERGTPLDQKSSLWLFGSWRGVTGLSARLAYDDLLKAISPSGARGRGIAQVADPL